MASINDKARLTRWLPPLQVESENFLHLDLMRFIASMGIVVLHWRNYTSVPESFLAFRAQMTFLGSFVDLFFVISGFIIAHVYQDRIRNGADFGQFMRRRFARLGPLHYLTFLFFLLLMLTGSTGGGGAEGGNRYDAACILPNLTLTHAAGLCQGLSFNYPSWSISAEMGCYLLFPVFLWVFRRSPWLLLALSAAGFAAFYAVGKAGPDHREWWNWTWDFGVIRALPAFALGMAFYGLRHVIARLPFPRLLICVFMAAWMILAMSGVWLGFAVPFTYLVVLATIAADMRGKVNPGVRVLAPLGSLTYSLYMLHPMIGSVAFGVIAKALHLPPVLNNLWVAICLPLALVASYISLNFFEKPCRIWLSGGRKRAKAAKPDMPASEPSPL